MNTDQIKKVAQVLRNYRLKFRGKSGSHWSGISIPDYIKFIQLQLKGLKGMSTTLPLYTYEKLLFGFPIFSFGWFNGVDETTQEKYAYNQGNAGAFITQVELFRSSDRAYIIFSNAATLQTEEGIKTLLIELKRRYGKSTSVNTRSETTCSP